MDVTVERSADPEVAQAILRASGWRDADRETRRRFDADPEGHFVARAPDGTPLGVVSAIAYGEDLAWVGGMVVLEASRRQGVGRTLLERALQHVNGRRLPVTGLDATAAGRPLYEKLGFTHVATTPRWVRPDGAPRPDPPPLGPYAVYPISACEIMELHAFDRPRFGANRARALAGIMNDLPDRAFVAFHRTTGAIAGFAMGQERFIGPVVADAPEVAAWLLFACERAGTPPIVQALDLNPRAFDVLRAAGYAPDGAFCTRMTRGGPLPGRPETVFAIGAYALG